MSGNEHECAHCGGTGLEPHGVDDCHVCEGTGEAKCAICGGSPNNPMHSSKYHSSEVANQHEYEAAS